MKFPPGRAILLAVALLCLVSGASCGNVRKKKAIVYLPTQETVEQFGDGRYELAATGRGTILRDIKSSRTLLAQVVGWLEDNGRIYLKGQDGTFLVLDPDADSWESYRTMDDVPEEDREAASRIPRRATFAPTGGL
jgi:hypothetical protein